MRLIDADELKEYIHNQDGRPFIGITIGEAFQMMVDEQPTIEERKTGKWEQDPLAKALDVYICSECKQPLQCRGEYGSLAKVNFCPTCGARMRL